VQGSIGLFRPESFQAGIENFLGSCLRDTGQRSSETMDLFYNRDGDREGPVR
jgi:hypothetical protein